METRRKKPFQSTTNEEIAVLAYELWLRRGCPQGSPEVDWFQAEYELKNQTDKHDAPRREQIKKVRHAAASR
jgi:hypothetical protein